MPLAAAIFWNGLFEIWLDRKKFFDQFQKANEWETLRGYSTKCVTVKVTNSVVLTEVERRGDAGALRRLPSCAKGSRAPELSESDQLVNCALKCGEPVIADRLLDWGDETEGSLGGRLAQRLAALREVMAAGARFIASCLPTSSSALAVPSDGGQGQIAAAKRKEQRAKR